MKKERWIRSNKYDRMRERERDTETEIEKNGKGFEKAKGQLKVH
jgi:hypothetical protein